MNITRTSILCMGLLATLTHCGDDRGLDPTPVEDDRALSGGAATVFDASSLAFENPIPSLDGMDLDRFLAGDAAFEQVFVTSPAAVGHGLGPVFNQTSCVGCHARDGRGREGIRRGLPFYRLHAHASQPTRHQPRSARRTAAGAGLWRTDWGSRRIRSRTRSADRCHLL